MRFIDNLVTTQNGIRNPSQIDAMTHFVQNGGFFTLDTLKQFAGEDQRLISISRFPDEIEYMRNGHHRVLAIHLGGRDYIHSDEYELQEWTYEQFLTPNLQAGFYTPFDPRTHVRIADFGLYLADVEYLLAESISDEEILDFIKTNAYRYRIPRSTHHIKYLI